MEAVKNTPLISIIVPIYNAEKYLKRCVSSICRQTYTNIEIILVNDGSKDSSLAICQEFGKQDQRILIKDIPNGGVSNARNTGLLAASGEYIQFLDSDDYMLDNYIEELYDQMTTSAVDMVVCSIKVLNNNLDELDYWDAENHVLDLEHPDKDVVYNFFDKFLVFGPVNKLFKKEILATNNILYDTSISYGEDLLLNLEYLQYSKKIGFNNQVYWPYVQDNTNSLSNKRRPDKIHIVKKLHASIRTFFERTGCNEDRFKRLLHQRMFDYCHNECFAVINDETLGFSEQRNFIHGILKDKELRESYPYVDRSKYASWIFYLMKYRLSTFFILIIKLIARKKK